MTPRRWKWRSYLLHNAGISDAFSFILYLPLGRVKAIMEKKIDTRKNLLLSYKSKPRVAINSNPQGINRNKLGRHIFKGQLKHEPCPRSNVSLLLLLRMIDRDRLCPIKIAINLIDGIILL